MDRKGFIGTLLGFGAAVVLPKGTVAKRYQKVYLEQCFVRGFKFYCGAEIVDKMNLNGKLQLLREPSNPYDANAIALYYDLQKIGFVPREKNKMLSTLMDSNLLHLEAEVTHIETDADTWEQVHIVIFSLKEITENVPENEINSFAILRPPRYKTLGLPQVLRTYSSFEEMPQPDSINFKSFLPDINTGAQNQSLTEILNNLNMLVKDSLLVDSDVGKQNRLHFSEAVKESLDNNVKLTFHYLKVQMKLVLDHNLTNSEARQIIKMMVAENLIDFDALNDNLFVFQELHDCAATLDSAF